MKAICLNPNRDSVYVGVLLLISTFLPKNWLGKVYKKSLNLFFFHKINQVKHDVYGPKEASRQFRVNSTHHQWRKLPSWIQESQKECSVQMAFLRLPPPHLHFWTCLFLFLWLRRIQKYDYVDPIYKSWIIETGCLNV